MPILSLRSKRAGKFESTVIAADCFFCFLRSFLDGLTGDDEVSFFDRPTSGAYP